MLAQEFKKGFGSYDYDKKNSIDNRELKCERKASGIDNIWSILPQRCWVCTQFDACRIMKPVGGRQGKGIFLFNKLCEIGDWKKGVTWSSDDPQADTYLAQHYISNPYLVRPKLRLVWLIRNPNRWVGVNLICVCTCLSLLSHH